jgi:hypothetical protein
MIEIIASSYFQFFPGDFVLFGLAGTITWYIKSKKDEDF